MDTNRQLRLEARKASLRVVAEALGGDRFAYRVSGTLLREAHVGDLEELRELTAPERVSGIGPVAVDRIRRWRETVGLAV